MIFGIDPTKTYTALTDLPGGITLGTETDDPRNGTANRASNKVRLVRADSAVAAGDAVIMKTAETDVPHAVVPSSAVAQAVVGIAEVAIAANSYGWITTKGYVPSCKVLDASSAGDKLGTSSTAGTLGSLDASSTVTQAEARAAIAAAAGKGLVAVTDGDGSNLGSVFIN